MSFFFVYLLIYKNRKKKPHHISISTMLCIFVILVGIVFPSTLSLRGIYLASQGLKAVSIACNGPSSVGGEPVSIWLSGV